MALVPYNPDVDEKMMAVAKIFAEEFPRKTISISVSAHIYHSRPFNETVIWSATIGHRETVDAKNYAELCVAVLNQYSPQSKRDNAAELRRQADVLEKEAMTAEELSQQSADAHRSSMETERFGIEDKSK